MTTPRSRRRVLFALAPFVGLALAASGCGSSVSGGGGGGDADGPVKIGLVVPQSGIFEPLGVDMIRGFELYLSEHDGKLGGHDVEIVKADEGALPDQGVPAVQKVVTQNNVSAVVGIANSATALGVKDIATNSKVPLIVTNAGADDLADGSPYIWRTSFTNGAVGESLGPVVAEAVEDGKVYVMAPDYTAGQEYAEGFKRTFTAAGGKVVGESYTPLGKTTDWQPYLNKALNSGAKAVYAFYAGAEAVAFVKQYESFGLAESLPLYAPGFLTEGGVLAAQGDAAEGVFTSLHYGDQLDTPENKAFVDAYTDVYSAAPTVYSVQAYDAAAVLDQALQKADGTTGEDIADALGIVGDVESPRGTWSFDDDHNPVQPFFLRQVQIVEGKPVNVIVKKLD